MQLELDADVKTWGGDSQTKFGRGHALTIGSVPLQNAAIFECRHSGHETDGKFGPRQLNSKLIEIDFDRNQIILHKTRSNKLATWQQVPVTIDRGMLFINGTIDPGDEPVTNRFLVHSGYSGFALLDDEFVARHKSIDALEVITESELTDSSGHKIKTKKSTLPRFSVAGISFENAPVSFFHGAIGQQKHSIIGGDFLKRFHLFIDLNEKTLYLKKSPHFAADYF